MFTRRRSSWKRKSRRRSWFPIVLLLVGVPIALELLVRGIAYATGTSEQLTANSAGKSELIEAYRLGFLSPDGQPYEALPNQGHLMAVRNPLMGYQLLPDQTSEFWTINAQGFRDDQPVTPEKAAGEVRIFVLGGSTAFGQLNSDNQMTLASHLEKLLNDRVTNQKTNPTRFQPATLPYRADQVAEVLALPPRIPEQQYRVINAAVPGYASGNELAMLMQQVVAYNPDMVVLLNSYQDLMLPSSQVGADIPGLDALIQGERESPTAQFTQSVQDWFDRLYVVRAVDRYVLQSQSPEEELAIALNLVNAGNPQPLDQALAADDAELDRRIARYRNHLLQMVRWSSATRKRLFIGLQPEITGRAANAMPPEEAAILTKLGDSYAQRMQVGYTKLSEAAEQVAQSSANAQLLDLYKLYETYEGQAFQSPTSLTDEANQVLASKFFEAIVRELAIEPRPFGS
ncbi:SGNH/GDSL hydrolase family protein [Thermocoleostomius sinensis]|uniref:SGNH/GDSL hydrolase family protein n=1 Tax=Thermocoleostomius sinensis A174 TaxID=2016057 RepID=A0A9E8ZCG0_9CYAN|nr:SGNH/GDSL hydrolase family protein [Thermocoleostomius sinensis]WAL58853.1 SGNH/GDSL hydrolase family protein [Thermocoleostomius sinensis A174]